MGREMVNNGGHELARAPSPANVSCTSGVGSSLSWISRQSHAELVKSWVPPGLMFRSKPNERMSNVVDELFQLAQVSHGTCFGQRRRL
jgi:hypothetical protein